MICGNALHLPLKDESVQCVVTSPAYWGLRDYGVSGQLGLEPTPELYVQQIVEVFREVRRVLRKDGTVWLNLGDSYATGAGQVGECPGGGQQGERWKGYRGERRDGKHKYLSDAMGPLTQPNRMPIRGLKPKDLIGIPWRVAFALQADGWYLRSEIIWSKPNPMPESVTDRPTKSHEYLFLLAKSERYYYDHGAIFEPLTTAPEENYPARAQILGRGKQAYPGAHQDKSGGYPPSYRGSSFTQGKTAPCRQNVGQGKRIEQAGRNKRSVWTVATQPFPEAHFATFPEDLVKPCILAGCPAGGVVLDPFVGSGTTVKVAKDLGRIGIGLDLKMEYLKMAQRRAAQEGLILDSAIWSTPAGGAIL